MPRARGEEIVEGDRAAKQLDRFIARYSPEVARLARQVLAGMRRRLPGATELVYDNYNALAIGFGPSDRSSDAVFSVALYPRWVSLFFLDGARLADPDGILKGSGSRVRHVVLTTASRLDAPGVKALIAQALERSGITMSGGATRIIIKSISPRQRPRRPATIPSDESSRAARNRRLARTDRSRKRRPPRA
jgi:hypothetical protein